MKKMHRLASILVIIAMLASMVPALSEAQELPVDALEPEEVWGEYDEVGDLDAFELGDIAFLEDADSEVLFPSEETMSFCKVILAFTIQRSMACAET